MNSSSSWETKLILVVVLSALGVISGCSESSTKHPAVEDPLVETPGVVNPDTQPAADSVTVAPASASIVTGQTQQFTVTAANSQDSVVTWLVDNIPGGNIEIGTISADGLYTPPRNVGTHTITASSVASPARSGTVSVSVTLPAVPLFTDVLTYHYDNARTGQNLREKVLTPVNVKTATFGKLYSFPVDGAVYAQPLYVSNLSVGGRLRNVVFVATEHDSVYAFDADNQADAPLWQVSFIDPANGITPVLSADTHCNDIDPEIGITSTPVIDIATGTLYLVAMTKENGTIAHRLHALDITTGSEKFGGGKKIQASVPGTALPNDGKGNLIFSSALENQRAALLLNDNAIHIAFGSFCDVGDHHGWQMTYDAKTLAQLGAFSATPTGTEGGIWQSGGGPAADAYGNVYTITGDGTFNGDSGGRNFGNTFLKFSGALLKVADYFTPFNQSTLDAVNGDLGSGGALILPDQATGPTHLLVSAGKQGTIYLLDRDNLGKYQTGSDSQIVQSITGPRSLFATPAYFENTVYMAPSGDKLTAYRLANGQLSILSQSPNTFRWPGATAIVSANGSTNGVVWALETNGSGATAILHAYSATDLSVELYNSGQNSARDYAGSAVKFTVPVVANGKVYLGAQGQVSVFGLLP